MHKALDILGYRVSPRSWKLLRPILNNNWNEVRVHAEKWDALEDNPIPLIYKELDIFFPRSKFILTIRDAESWYNSVSYHIGSMRTPMHEWVFGRGKGLPKDDKAHSIRIYEDHNKSVEAYFSNRPEDLLICDLRNDNTWDVLCNFLNQALPDQPFPHSNSSNFNIKKPVKNGYSVKAIRKRIKFYAQLSYFDALGLIPKR